MVQYFIDKKEKEYQAIEKKPKILYVCDTQPAAEILPRALHMHQDILEIVFITEGKGTHLIGKKKYETEKGDILIFNSGVLHDEITHADEVLKVYCCGITDLKIKDLLPNHLTEEKVTPVIKSGRHEQEIKMLLEMMITMLKGDHEHVLEIANHLLSTLLLLILELPTENQKDVKELELVGEAKEYIDQYYMEDINLESISKTLNISSSYLSHIFKEETGFSPIQYIIRRRIGQAQNLLINTSYTATQIALMVGYDNTNYFNSLFTKNIGLSPQKYRKYWTENKVPD